MSAATFTIDRRPICYSSAFSGVYPPTPGANIYGIAASVLADPAAWIAGLRATANTYNIVRRMPHMMQGAYQSQGYPCYVTLQASMSSMLAAFTPQTGEEWEYYSGGYLPVNPAVDVWQVAPTNAQPSTSGNADTITAQLAPFRARGFVACWHDALVSNPAYVQGTLATKLGAAGWSRTGTEAIPTTGGPPSNIDTTLIGVTRYWALQTSFYDTYNPARSWTVDPRTTEVHVAIDDPAATAAVVQDFADRGFIPGIAHTLTSASACERIAQLALQRWKGYRL